jgi:hypothetical protein
MSFYIQQVSTWIVKILSFSEWPLENAYKRVYLLTYKSVHVF